MLSVKNIIKSICPPILYHLLKKLYFCGSNGIDASHKYSGKVFCVGFHKTGTTSLEQVLIDFGYRVGDQAVGEMLLGDCQHQDYNRLIRLCEAAEAFQDTPFCQPAVYRVLDKTFSDAKFILTVRDSQERWFQSLVRFHTRLFSSDPSRLPTEADLDNAMYRYRGFVLELVKFGYCYPDVALYDEVRYKQFYTKHNQEVIEYFSDRPDKLLVLNVAQPGAYQELAAFLNVKVSEKKKFPWKNKS